jgi:hypothetical protein
MEFGECCISLRISLRSTSFLQWACQVLPNINKLFLRHIISVVLEDLTLTNIFFQKRSILE